MRKNVTMYSRMRGEKLRIVIQERIIKEGKG